MPDVVIADDDHFVRQVLQARFEKWNYNVRTANDGDKLLEQVARAIPDVVITDIIMPERDGIEAIGDLRRCYPGLKVVAMSGGGCFGTSTYLEAAGKLGADALLMKPFDSQALFDVLARIGVSEGARFTDDPGGYC